MKTFETFKENQNFINRVSETCSWDSYDRLISLEKQIKDMNQKYLKELDADILKNTNDTQFKDLHSPNH